ncbi:MAG: hypothetical protein M1834_008472 [Cirrosporium novae-zelandiae]|nr:MAG: hypothetical protein M1834_008472 [Cirrosporium novae-zelandiae]
MALKVIIIGAGLAGSLLANGLIRNDLEVEVYERDIEDSKREGYQIRLGAMSLRGFHTCLNTDLCQDIISRFGKTNGQIYTTPVLYNIDLEPLRGFGKTQPYSKSAPINRVVLRDALVEPLKKARVVHFEKKYVECEIISGKGGRDKIRAHFNDGTSAEGDIMIAADGSGSKINREVGLDNILERKERCGFIAKCQLPVSKLRQLPRQLRAGPIVIEENGISFIASAYLPEKKRNKLSSRPKTYKQQDFVQLHDPRDYWKQSISSESSVRSTSRRSISSDETDISYDEAAASLMWNMNVPREKLPEDMDIDDPIEFVIDIISHWSPTIHDIIRSTPEEEFYRFYGRVGMCPESNWRDTGRFGKFIDPRKGHPRIWFIGDSIHPMLPTRAMGGNQAMCDAGEVCDALTNLAQTDHPTNAQILSAVSAYEATMIPRAFEWVEKSNNAGGKYVKMTSKILGGFKNRASSSRSSSKGPTSYRLDNWKGKTHLFWARRTAEIDANLGVVLRRVGFKKDLSEREFDVGK